MSELDQFKHFDTALARLAFREEGMRPLHTCGNFALRQPCFLAGRDQFFKKSVIESLMGRRPSLREIRVSGFFCFFTFQVCVTLDESPNKGQAG